MTSESIIVQKPPNTFFCPFSLYTSSVILAFLHGFSTISLAALYKIEIEATSTIVEIVFWIHVCCGLTAFAYFAFCLFKRKLGYTYEIILHTYLLTGLLNGLTALFGVLYVPLFFLQTEHSFMEGIDYFIVFLFCAAVLGIQWGVKKISEQMLPVMEQDFKV
ncbi:unnamed protein product [Caenorhabditis bovis]|uniref:Uncharacterized protein n=1 Tax=Caenorhabditis bovis TaxID=2654633 RepID=A0A8S1E862_9PELO|nr:unnamed protein product [Caenorhabditis bovis]